MLNLYIEDNKGNAVDDSTLLEELRPPVRLCVLCISNAGQLEHCQRDHCEKKFHPKTKIRGMLFGDLSKHSRP
jgi:hypothetical protein